ncbi:MAG: ACT domain-containing protein [Haloarculaceae archaeon]
MNVIQAGTERYGEELTVVLIGHIVETDLSNTLERIEQSSGASVRDLSLSTPEDRDGESSARVRVAAQRGETAEILATVRTVASEKDLQVIEPLTAGDGA